MNFLPLLFLVVAFAPVDAAVSDQEFQNLVSQVQTLKTALEAQHNSTTAALAAQESVGRDAMNAGFLFSNAFLVFFMQAGFMILEAGMVRRKHQVNILIKNVIDASLSALAFWMFGYGFAFGGNENLGFIGTDKFAWQLNSDETGWIFQFAFAATSATIISGAMAERTRFSGYALSTLAMTGFVYPTVVHWVWGGGWLYAAGFHDFAGSTVVHVVGGFAALVGTIIIRPRTGRFKGDKMQMMQLGAEPDTDNFRPSSLALCTLGTLILWYGWFGFNCGSALTAYGRGARRKIALVAVNTVMGPAGAIFCALLTQLLNPFNHGGVSLDMVLNCLLSGLVGITAGCDTIAPYAAFLIGAVSTLTYMTFSSLVLKVGIDDVVGASSVHFMSGTWGTIAVGFAADCGLQKFVSSDPDDPTTLPCENGMQPPNCLLCAGGQLLGVQLYGVLATICWVGAMACIIFSLLRLIGILRVSKQEEADGLDHSYNIMKKKATLKDTASTSVVPTHK